MRITPRHDRPFYSDNELMQLIIEERRYAEMVQQSWTSHRAANPHLAEEPADDDNDGDLAFCRIDQFYI